MSNAKLRAMKPSFRYLALTLLLPALLVGCETLSPAECATANWRQLGVQDGNRGRSDRAADYYESCQKAGIGVDVASYRQARSEGLQNYCQYANAIREGLAGRPYGGVCPAPFDPTFRALHDAAYQAQSSHDEVQRLQNEQDRWQYELRDGKTPEERRRALRDLLSRSDRRMEDARRSQRDNEFRLDRLQRDLRLQGIPGL